MNSLTLRTLRATLAAGAALALLAGCSTTAPTPVASPTAASVAPTPTPTVEAVSSPQPLIDLTCDELGAALPLASTFATMVTSQNRAITEYRAAQYFPSAFEVRSAGGLVCEWSNGLPDAPFGGNFPDYAGVTVFVLPEPGVQWDKYVERRNITGDRLLSCYTLDGEGMCFLDELGANRWIAVTVRGAVSESAASTLTTSAVDAVTAAGPGGAPWTVPAGTLALADDCTTYIDSAEAQVAVGIVEPLFVYETGEVVFDIDGAAEAIDPGLLCKLGFENDEAGVGFFTILRGGEWGWNDVKSAIGATPLELEGLGADNEAWLRCGPGIDWCNADLIIGGNWISIELAKHDFGGPYDIRAAAQAVAATIVRNVVP